ncbi:glycoside hydrolase family 16 protein [Vibrio agarivorans]|uniref:Glycoside hydrolase family 16 protein n=1 Tax=Vibrio agarivorans TaxID=153622 RepID=A0ABT7Y3H4_9VIBR|nr:glycoside hydrolase family 16 protein [Vibrio agarivorans]MDN2482589.1 glycoside hydrolase family 16 protein [Vibrio agarivorans]
MRPTKNCMDSLCITTTLLASICASNVYAAAEEYQLVWADEFDYTGLPDSEKWGYETGYVRNNELQYYTEADPLNAYVSDGHLQIIARRPHATHPKVTSASLTTENIVDWTYGKIEVRAKLPTEKGMWPAIWTLGSNIREVYWPKSGEIDIMEYVTSKLGVIHSNTVYFDYDLNTKQQKNGNATRIEYLDAFYTYAIEWTPESIRFFVDDKQHHEFHIDVVDKDRNPFHKPHYLIMNLAVGGAWAGEPDYSSFPATFTIDYVRVYQKPQSQ